MKCTHWDFIFAGVTLDRRLRSTLARPTLSRIGIPNIEGVRTDGSLFPRVAERAYHWWGLERVPEGGTVFASVFVVELSEKPREGRPLGTVAMAGDSQSDSQTRRPLLLTRSLSSSRLRDAQSASRILTARLAQSVEHGTFNPRVVGSSPTSGVAGMFLVAVIVALDPHHEPSGSAPWFRHGWTT